MAVVKETIESSDTLRKTPLFRAFGLSRATFYRQNCRVDPDFVAELAPPQNRTARHACRVSGRALSIEEEQSVRDILYGERFVDQTPNQIYSTLLDEGDYHCSVRTMYRLLKKDGPCKTRTRTRKVTSYEKPELLATRPNELWSWDITRLKGPTKYSYFQLYVILDVFSRYIVGWMVAEVENQELAAQLIDEAIANQKVKPDTLSLHADRGAAMTSKSVALLLSDMGVIKTHSRPHTSNDNPYSEAHFKTLKYRPDFPGRFGCIEDARILCGKFFRWYNGEHRHSGIALLTPAAVHYGKAAAIIAERQLTLDAAYQAHPERFVKSRPIHPPIPDAVWINAPEKNIETETEK